ncbi:MAG: tRNA guanosine(34) transglycosylase Tgt [Acidimicrobiales bacterium]
MSSSPVEVHARDGDARLGTVTTARGAYPVPIFMPVGTRGAVKTLDAADLESVGADIVLANAYHLMLRPGPAVVSRLGGIHRFMGWERHLLTDSGGFQVHSLSPEVSDEGVNFTSVYDGSRLRCTPESVVEVQAALGADVQMTLDVCTTLPAADEVVRLGVERTLAWAQRARRHFDRLDQKPEGQALYGIVQGGIDPDLRRESAERTVALGFDGYGVGGLSVGEPRSAMLEALAATIPHLPADRPRYLMGVGDPVGIIEAVALGVDQFDCVAPTRMARHGSVLTGTGRLNLRNAVHADGDGPLDPTCNCITCRRWSRGYLRHLLGVGEPTAWRLLTIHNLTFMSRLMADARSAIRWGRLEALRAEIRARWPDRSGGPSGG